MNAQHANEGTLYDAIARLRPNWLATKGVATQGPEYPDGLTSMASSLARPESLRNIQADAVTDIRYYDITQAGARFGIRVQNTGGSDRSQDQDK